MNKIYLIVLLMFVAWGVRAQSQQIVSKTVIPFSASVPVVFQDHVKGGFHQVANEAARLALPDNLKTVGMIVAQQDSHDTYQWVGSAWQPVVLVRAWAVGAAFFVGDLFLYNETLLLAKGAGIIDAATDPLTDTANWGRVSGISGSLDPGRIYVGDSNGVAMAVELSGDATLDDTGKLSLNSVSLSGDLNLDATGEATIGEGRVNSLKLENLSITNEDISQTAAIEGTKIAPDFGSLAISTTGKVAAQWLKMGSGTLPSTAEDGAVEYDGVHFYGTVGTNRVQLDNSNIFTKETVTVPAGANAALDNSSGGVNMVYTINFAIAGVLADDIVKVNYAGADYTSANGKWLAPGTSGAGQNNGVMIMSAVATADGAVKVTLANMVPNTSPNIEGLALVVSYAR